MERSWGKKGMISSETRGEGEIWGPGWSLSGRDDLGESR